MNDKIRHICLVVSFYIYLNEDFLIQRFCYRDLCVNSQQGGREESESISNLHTIINGHDCLGA